MITKEALKSVIDKVPDEYLEILYRILKAFEIPVLEKPLEEADAVSASGKPVDLDWHQFINETYGSLTDAPIQRGKQGEFEKREAIK